MILHQFYLKCLAHASYIVADEATGEAAVVDPQRDIDHYLEFAAGHHLRIEHVILTHLHADFVAGHLELRARTNARVYLGAAAQAEYPFTPLHEGDTIDLGRVRLTTIESPGHTVESISLVVFDRDLSETVPQAVLTGDTLFVGDVGRPDLQVAVGWSAADLGRLLYRSLHAKLLALPDSTLVYPAHGAGSLCGKAIGKETFSTIGEQRLENYALQPMQPDEFVRVVTADQPEAPAYFSYDAALNSREHPTLTETIARELEPLDLPEVLARKAGGAQLLDTRDPGAFAAAHLAGSINVGLGGEYATGAGSVLDPSRPIVLISDPAHEREAAVRLGRIGFDNVTGYLRNGLHSLKAHPELTATTERLSPARAFNRLKHGEVLALDVRSPGEREEKFIPDSVHIPLAQLAARANELPLDRPLLLYCSGGYRSSIAASVLSERGFAVSDLAGGIAAWEQAKLPVVS